MSPGAQLGHYSQWKPSRYSYWSPGSFLSEFDTCTWTDDFAPRRTAVRGLKGRDIGAWFFRGGNRTVLFSPNVFF